MAAMAISFVRGEQAGPCPSGTVALALTSTDGVKPLNDALKCSGSGDFNVTLLGPLQIEERIEISDQKNVTVTAAVDNELGGTNDDSLYVEIDAGHKTGIFSVSNGSTLNIIKLILVGGYSADGGAVAVTASSSLNVFDCFFTNNRASKAGGEQRFGSITEIIGSKYLYILRTNSPYNRCFHQNNLPPDRLSIFDPLPCRW